MKSPLRIVVLSCLVLCVLGALAWWWLQPASADGPAGQHLATPSVPASAATAATAAGSRPGQDENAWATKPPRHAGTAPSDAVSAEETHAARCNAARSEQLRDYRARFDPRASADAAIAHAWLTRLGENLAREQGDIYAAGREFAAASQRWPKHLDLAWFALMLCDPKAGDTCSRAWAHARRIDGDNAALWLWALAKAHQRKDASAWEQALHQAATAAIYDPRVGVVYLRLRPLLAALPVPADCRGVAFIEELASRYGGDQAAAYADVMAAIYEAMPAYGGLGGCKDAQTLSPQARRDCASLLTRVADGDTLIEQLVATSLQVRLLGDGPGHAQWRERYRRLQWLSGLLPAAAEAGIFSNGRIWADGEVAMLRAFAIDQGMWPPPADWLPENARARSQILHGREPDKAH